MLSELEKLVIIQHFPLTSSIESSLFRPGHGINGSAILFYGGQKKPVPEFEGG